MPSIPSILVPAAQKMTNRPALRSESLALLSSLFFVLFSNSAFWSQLLQGREFPHSSTLALIFAIGILLVGAQWFLLLLLFNRWTSKALLYLLLPLTALADYFTSGYGIYLNKSMMTNLIETDIAEAMELFEWGILSHLALYALIPMGLVMTVRIHHERLHRVIFWRLGSLLAAFALLAGGLWLSSNELIPLMRAEKEMRYLITPANYLVSGVRAVGQHGKGQLQERTPVGEDAVRVNPPPYRRPRLLVLVVGETVRAANWGLSGYSRQTTPLLARHNVINFDEVVSCGTDTATSLPCMFSMTGRHDYDAARIRSTESVLHVLNRAGVSVLWRDNQSGCKGGCDNLPYEQVSAANNPALCNGERCYDDILRDDLHRHLTGNNDKLIVLHMLGNHGPAYYQRYPDGFRHWAPTCDTTRLATCSQQALLNTYDNAILYTDHFLAQTIELLSRITDHDSAMIYVSDHGESLGENGLYLHGFPYSIAPKEQTRIPMVLWLSAGLSSSDGIDEGCLRKLASSKTVSHDHLSHTLLGLFDITSNSYQAEWDLLRPCHSNRVSQAVPHPAQPG
jgi:lipid A ethanolaminephosphotransferase